MPLDDITPGDTKESLSLELHESVEDGREIVLIKYGIINAPEGTDLRSVAVEGESRSEALRNMADKLEKLE